MRCPGYCLFQSRAACLAIFPLTNVTGNNPSSSPSGCITFQRGRLSVRCINYFVACPSPLRMNASNSVLLMKIALPRLYFGKPCSKKLRIVLGQTSTTALDLDRRNKSNPALFGVFIHQAHGVKSVQCCSLSSFASKGLIIFSICARAISGVECV